MTFTYDTSLATDRDKIRFRIGDVSNTVEPYLSDEEIAATFTSAGSLPEAMARCAEALAARFFRHATTKQAASLKVSYEDRVKGLLELADRIRSGAEAIGLAEIILTGATKTELDESAADTDLIQPAFKRGQFDNPDGSTSLANEESAA